MSRFFQARALFNHWLDVVDQHSVHSPFFYDFFEKVIRNDATSSTFERFEEVRNNMLNSATMLTVQDLGSGSMELKDPKRTIGDIAKTSLTPAPLARLYHRIAEYSGSHKIIELGTSLGVTSLYLSEVKGATVHTFEGSHALADVALTNFEYFDKKNIHLIEGDIGVTLPRFLQDDLSKIGLAFIDANHRYSATMQYFDWMMKRFNEQSVLILDDIHYSADMDKAWKELKKHDLVYGSIDLFRCGILFFEPALNRQHFVWKL